MFTPVARGNEMRPFQGRLSIQPIRYYLCMHYDPLPFAYSFSCGMNSAAILAYPLYIAPCPLPFAPCPLLSRQFEVHVH